MYPVQLVESFRILSLSIVYTMVMCIRCHCMVLPESRIKRSRTVYKVPFNLLKFKLFSWSERLKVIQYNKNKSLLITVLLIIIYLTIPICQSQHIPLSSAAGAGASGNKPKHCFALISIWCNTFIEFMLRCLKKASYSQSSSESDNYFHGSFDLTKESGVGVDLKRTRRDEADTQSTGRLLSSSAFSRISETLGWNWIAHICIALY